MAQTRKHDVRVHRERTHVEDVGEIHATRGLGIGADELSKVETRVPCAHRVSLNDSVRAVTVEARLDESK
jgi:hypothetical protein